MFFLTESERFQPPVKIRKYVQDNFVLNYVLALLFFGVFVVFKSGLVTDFNKFLNSQNIYLCCMKP